MADTASPARTRRIALKRWQILCLLIVAFPIGRLAWFWYLSEPSRQIRIERETTYVDGPLGADGYVDYIAVFNERQSAGINITDNAVAVLVRAYGGQAIYEGIRARYFEMLGVPPPNDGDDLLDDYEFIRSTTSSDSDDRDAIDRFRQSREAAAKRPWARDEFPDVAELLEKNAKPLTLVVEASRKERYYSPFLSDETPPCTAMILLPIEQEQWTSVRQLTARAMLRLWDDDAYGAWDDLFACERLARLSGQQPFLITHSVSCGTQRIAFGGEVALIGDLSLTPELARKCLDELQSLPPRRSVIEIMGDFERLAALDFVMLTARGEASKHSFVPAMPQLNLVLSGAVDWNIVLEQMNDTFDQLVEILKLPDGSRRMQLEQFAEPIAAFEMPSGSLDLRSFFYGRRQVSIDVGTQMVKLHLPAVDQSLTRETSALARHRLAIVGFALAAHRHEQGAYPESLSELVPDVLYEVPLDPWSGSDLIYRRTDEGFVLYSVNADLQDNGGLWFADKDWQDLGDIVVEVKPQPITIKRPSFSPNEERPQTNP